MLRESGVFGSVAQRVQRAAAVASRQHGAISREQLRAIGYTDHMIDNELRNGRLVPAFRGVYFLGHHAITEKSRAMAAVLACGAGAVVSHLSAAHLWAFVPYPAQFEDVDVTDVSAAAPDKLERAFDEALFKKKVQLPQLNELIERSTGDLE